MLIFSEIAKVRNVSIRGRLLMQLRKLGCPESEDDDGVDGAPFAYEMSAFRPYDF